MIAHAVKRITVRGWEHRSSEFAGFNAAFPFYNIQCSPFITCLIITRIDLDITQSCCGSQIFLPWNFTKEIIGK